MERRSTKKTSVVSGSVWETRMINDEIMGGFKVFNEKNPEEENIEKKQRVQKQSPIGKRKTWKSDSSIQIAVKKSPNGKVKEGNLAQIKKPKPKSSDLDVSERNPVEISNGIEKDLAQFGEMKTESIVVFDEKSKSKSGAKRVLDEPKKDSIEIKTEKFGEKKGVDESIEDFEKNPVEIEKFEKTPVEIEKIEKTPVEIEKIEKNPVEIEKIEKKPVEIGKIEKTPVEIENLRSDFGEEKDFSSDLINVGIVKSVPNLDEKEFDEKIEVKLEKQSIQEIKSIHQKSKQILNEEKKLNQKKDKQLPITVRKHSPNLMNYSRINSTPSKIKSIPDFDRFQSQSNPCRIPQSHGKLLSLIDLVMWRDASKSAFVFGIGTFIIISSSYTKDINISLISVFSYLGLVYLAAIFIFRSIISRGVLDEDDTSEKYVVGEEEAMWLLKMFLPYLNECLIKIKALFSGDPATTMKLAVLLFVLARSGSSITIWKMAKLGFFGVFTVPKICSSYSAQLTAYGKFWVRRFQDAWESCSHKKAVGFGIFTLVWNLSSVVARIWAVFMLFAAFRYYQQSMVTDDRGVEEEPQCEPSWQGHVVGGRRLRRGPVNVVTTTKEKKRF